MTITPVIFVQCKGRALTNKMSTTIRKPKITSEVGVSHPRRFNLKEYISGFYSAIFLVIFCFLISSPCFASNVVINEILPNADTEWVEFYNPDNIDLKDYWLDDDTSFTDDSGTSKKQALTSLNISNPNYPYLEFKSFLNNDGDYVVLFSSGGELINQYQYTFKVEKDISLGRYPDGGDSWFQLSSATKGAVNSAPPPSPSPSPSPSPKPSPSPSPKTSPSPLPSLAPVVFSSPSVQPVVKTSSQAQKEISEATNEAKDFTGEVFGATESSDEATKSAEETKSETNSTGKVKLPLIISLIGLVLLLISAFPLLKPQLTNLIDKLKNH